MLSCESNKFFQKGYFIEHLEYLFTRQDTSGLLPLVFES